MFYRAVADRTYQIVFYERIAQSGGIALPIRDTDEAVDRFQDLLHNAARQTETGHGQNIKRRGIDAARKRARAL